MGRFFSLFEREKKPKEKQKTRRRFIALHFRGVWNRIESPTCGFVLFARNSWNAGEISFHRLGTKTRNSFCVNVCFIARGVANTITTFSPYWDSKGASPFGRFQGRRPWQVEDSVLASCFKARYPCGGNHRDDCRSLWYRGADGRFPCVFCRWEG